MSSPPRILSLFGTRVIFGAERANIDVLASLAGQGCQILCLVRHEAWNDAVPSALAARGLQSKKVAFVDGWLRGWRLRTLIRNPIAVVVGNCRFLWLARKFKPTHIHAFNHFDVLSFLPSLALTRVSLIYNCGDQPVRHRWIWRLLWRFIAWRTQRFVAVSKFIARELERIGVEADKVEVIYARPPPRITSQNESVPPPPQGSDQDVVFVGQINADKGPHLLIEAFRNVAALYPQARLLIAGRISEWRGDHWARLLRESVMGDPVLRPRVIFLGFVENIPSLLQGRDVLVAPSLLEEALGLVVMEAKDAGIPSIVFPSGGLPEMIEHGVDGFVCPDKSVESLVAALKVYLGDRAVVVKQGAAARDSLYRLGTNKFAGRWLNVYTRSM